MMTDSEYTIDNRRVRGAFSRAAKDYEATAVLQKTVAERLVESFELLNVTGQSILDLGSGTGTGTNLLKRHFKKARFFQLDLASAMLRESRKKSLRLFSRQSYVCANANQLPFRDQSFDLVFSNLMLQWCPELDTVFSEISRVLKPGGLFIFSSFGPDTLNELRHSWQQVDADVHVNRFIDMHDVGDALIRHGLAEPVLSVEHFQLLYDDARELMRELKSIGANNSNHGRKKTLTGKNRLQQMLQHYESYRKEGKLPATYEVVYGHAWRNNMTTPGLETGEQFFSVESLRSDLKQRTSEQ